jgi:hypothetical protein
MIAYTVRLVCGGSGERPTRPREGGEIVETEGRKVAPGGESNPKKFQK